MTDDNKINLIGITTFRNKERKFGIKNKDRRQHMYVVGKTGVGKTALLKNMALQDIENGKGVAIIDPHGEFVEEVLDKIPSHRSNDVVYFNPADTDFPVGFNILEVSDPKHKHLVSSGLMGVFTKIWANVWSARMEYILANCILALLDTPGTTLLGIPRMLVDRDYRQKIVNNLKDPVVKSFWINEYEEWNPVYRNDAIAPIQNKVGQFLNVSLIRNIVGQSKSTINIPDIMDSNKILLVNVSKGRVGEDNSALLGSILITKIQLATMERVRIPEDERKDFYLYVDEFQNFVTEAFANILSEARKYRLNLIMAHQYVNQLIDKDSTKVRDAVFGNVGTMVVFRVGAADGEFLETEFTPEFTPDDLVHLPNFNIYLKLMVDGITSHPFSARTIPPIEKETEEGTKDKIFKITREKYGTAREEVEDKINKWSGISDSPVVLKPSVGNLHDAKCSICSKETKVPFKPEPGKNIYCKNCLKKVKEKAGNSNSKENVYQQEQPEISELKELGIEFKNETPSTEKKKGFNLKKFLPKISLKKDLDNKTVYFSPSKNKEKKKRKDVNLSELKKTINDVYSTKESSQEKFKEDNKPKEEKDLTPKEEEKDLTPKEEEKIKDEVKPDKNFPKEKNTNFENQGEIKPGEKIKFQ